MKLIESIRISENSNSTFSVQHERQLKTLFEKGLINEDELTKYTELIKYTSRHVDLSQYENKKRITEISSIICPYNPSLDQLVKAVNLGSPDDNTLFLKESDIHEHPSIEVSGTLSMLFNVSSGTKYLDAAKQLLVKDSDHSTKYDTFEFPMMSKLSFRESLYLLIYFPEILTMWDGFMAGGSYWKGSDTEKIQSLRLYRMNDYPSYLKIAKEITPVIDSRFFAPETYMRINI